MTLPRRLVLDANILLRAAWGSKVRKLLDTYESAVGFFAPDVCFADARKYIPHIAKRRGVDPTAGLQVLEQLEQIVEVVDCSLYEAHESSARSRIASRDVKDWPVVAVAMLLDCPIWTEDQDFFGSGIATWSTTNIELYLRNT